MHKLDQTSPTPTLRILTSIQRDMSPLNEKCGNLLQSVNFCSDCVSDFEKTISILNKIVIDIEKLTKDNLDLKKEVENLNSRVDALEQQLRSNNAEIHRISVKNNEDIVNIALEIGIAVDYPTTEANIDSFYKASTNDVSRPKSII
ncbi:unnamed protein product [Psylliodes chrysocephalus]|uniref:Uncharacterized protein n=1 Tax=Psylliodes chrysocephalus TaxID=3402493 RepID=A0A9P0D742_9CUCU|nr:unnamed protein product [Psylliodes chrysocephala]